MNILEFLWLYYSPFDKYPSYILWCIYNYYYNGIIIKDKKIIYSIILFADTTGYGHKSILFYEFFCSVKDLYKLYNIINPFYKKYGDTLHTIFDNFIGKLY